jgi:hypothetical protein
MAFKRKGMDDGRISALTGASRDTVRSIINRAKRGDDAMAQRVRRALQPHADARGVDVAELKRRILAAVALDDMVDAVLDDRDGDTEHHGGH